MKLLLLPVLAILTSCDGSTEYYYTVSNLGDSAITVDNVQGPDSALTYVISANDQKEILFSSKIGGTAIPSNKDFFTMVKVYNANGDSLTKKLWENENWIVEIEETKKRPPSYRHDYLFEVGDGDF